MSRMTQAALSQIGVALESLRRREHDRFVSVLPKEPLDALQDCRIIIDY